MCIQSSNNRQEQVQAYVTEIASLIGRFRSLGKECHNDRESPYPELERQELTVGLLIGRLACELQQKLQDQNYLDELAEIGKLTEEQLFSVQQCKIVYQFRQRPAPYYDDIGTFGDLVSAIWVDELSWELDNNWANGLSISGSESRPDLPSWLTTETATGLYKAIINYVFQTEFATPVEEVISRTTLTRAQAEKWAAWIELGPELEGSFSATVEYLSASGIARSEIDTWINSLDVHCDLDLAIQVLREAKHFPSLARKPVRLIKGHPVFDYADRDIAIRQLFESN